ncbi:hypothetical protein V2J09_011532 [Rumex salicifolius]
MDVSKMMMPAEPIKEDPQAKDLEELELSLPKERSNLASPFLYYYQNFWCPSMSLSNVVSFQTHFQAQDTDILVVSKPKSGTLWLKALAFAILYRKIYPTKPSNIHPLFISNPHQLVPFVDVPLYSTSLYQAHHSPRLFATHIPYNSLPESVKNSGSRIIYICRNPLDTAVSLWKFSCRIRGDEKGRGLGEDQSLEGLLDSICKGVEEFGPHWDHVLGYWRESLENPNKVLFIKFEDLKSNEKEVMKRIAQFMGCPFSPEEEETGLLDEISKLCSIGFLKELEVNKYGKPMLLGVGNDMFFRKGQVGDWANQLTPAMKESLHKVMLDKFHGSGLTFETEPIKEDPQAKDLEELELSLPKERSNLASPFLYHYQNFWCPSMSLSNVVSFQTHFQAQDTDILVVSKPKSGTLWLKALAFAILYRKIYPTKPSNIHPLFISNPHQLVPFVDVPLYSTSLSQAHHSPRLFATHIPYNSLPESVKNSGSRIIYICRNPLDTAVSLWKFSCRIRGDEKGRGLGEAQSLEGLLDSICKGVEEFGPHWDHVLGYWRESLENPNKVLFIKFEDLKSNEKEVMKRIAQFMGCPFSPEEEETGLLDEISKLCSIGFLKELEVNKYGKPMLLGVGNDMFFRKGQVGDWANQLTPVMKESLHKVMLDKFHGSGLTFEAEPIKEDPQAKDLEELELSLPKERSNLASPFLYHYQNFWCPSMSLSNVVSFQTHFQAQDTDILVVSKPKSGTLWLKALAFAILYRKIYPTKPSNIHPLFISNPHQLVPFVDVPLYSTSLSQAHHSPRLFATHIPYNSLPESVKNSGSRIIYICRNPLDTAVSLWKFSCRIRGDEKGRGLGEAQSLEGLLDSICKGVEEFGPHWDHVLGYWRESLENPNKVLFIKFEDLKSNEKEVMKRIAQFMGCPFSPEEEETGLLDEISKLCSIGFLKELEVNKYGKPMLLGVGNDMFFRKGQVGDWANQLTPAMKESLHKVMLDKFHGSGLIFEAGI